MGKFFGTNGVRGIFDDELTLDFLHEFTLAIGTYFSKGPILIGYDGRYSSPLVCKLISSTFNSIGFDCDVAGLVPTPCLEYCVKKLNYSGGIMITASHNPPQYNGIKPAASDGVEVSREDENIIEEIYENKSWLSTTQAYGVTNNRDVKLTYINGVISNINSDLIKSKKFKVVLDLGNGAQAVCAPQLCEMLDCEIFLVNEKIDGSFPGRGSEPTPQNLSALSEMVMKHNADLGIAFDGDGDRSIFCDDSGKILTGDKSALLLTKFLLKNNPNSTVVTCLNSDSNIESIASEFNSHVIRTKVGSVEVSRKMVPENALVGFEENGGFMYGKHNQVRDGCMTLALMLELLASEKVKLTNLISNLPKSFTTKDKVSCSSENVSKLFDSLKNEFPNADTTDGIKISFDSKNWVMIRPSGTEPIVRIYAESENQEKLDLLMSEFTQKVQSIISR